MTRSLRALAVAASLAGCGGAAAGGPAAEEPAPPPERPQVTLALRFEEAPDDAAGTPRTRVVLARIVRGEPTRTAEVTTVAGACSHAWPGRGVLLRARCSWAGAREEILVRQQDDEVVAAAGDGVEVRIELPEGALVEVLQPDTMPTDGTGAPPSIMLQPDAIRRR